MSATLDISVPEPVVVHFEPSKLRMNDDEFFQFCLSAKYTSTGRARGRNLWMTRRKFPANHY
jgi:hypothetical protein